MFGSIILERKDRKKWIPTAVLVLLFLDGVNGLASHRMNRKHKLSFLHRQQYPLTSLPLSYATDSTRLGRDPVQASIPQNMSLPLLLSDDGMLPSIRSTIPASTSTTRNNLITNTWQKLKGAMKIDRDALAKMGIDFGLTYNMISNINGSVTLSAAWYIASMKVR
jgi:hypothetical protein